MLTYLIFIWGFSVAFGISIFVEGLSFMFISNFSVIVIIIAPIIEELSKSAGFLIFKRQKISIQNGVILGTIVGFGFATTENLLYFITYNIGYLSNVTYPFYLRILGTTILHCIACAFIGYGYSKYVLFDKKSRSVIPYVVLSIGFHVFYNIFAISELYFLNILGLIITISITILFILLVRKEIRTALNKKITDKKVIFEYH
jgi:RsiW-degrading membrane proteinase PrsW (M82 family)